MLKFKKNVTITIAYETTWIFLCLFPIIAIILLFSGLRDLDDIFALLIIFLIFIILIDIILLIISLIAQIFIKTKYYIDKDLFTIKKENYIKKVRYNDISKITYDFGSAGKGGFIPSELIIFDKFYKESISIKNPSIIMVYLLKKRCKKAKVCYKHNKKIVLLVGMIINAAALVILLLIKLLSSILIYVH